ncbi:hypothetical protein TNCV_4326671 [Trichonephila clavipes]|nr:hypothetical protein TNCV_4326671 [Trichonephila clavipes]
MSQTMGVVKRYANTARTPQWCKMFSFFYSTPSLSSCREYRPLRTRTCGLCTIVNQHIFRLRGAITTSVRHIRDVGWTRWICCLASKLPGPRSLGFVHLATHRICLNAFDRPSSIGVGCAIKHAAALSAHFLTSNCEA